MQNEFSESFADWHWQFKRAYSFIRDLRVLITLLQIFESFNRNVYDELSNCFSYLDRIEKNIGDLKSSVEEFDGVKGDDMYNHLKIMLETNYNEAEKTHIGSKTEDLKNKKKKIMKIAVDVFNFLESVANEARYIQIFKSCIRHGMNGRILVW